MDVRQGRLASRRTVSGSRRVLCLIKAQWVLFTLMLAAPKIRMHAPPIRNNVSSKEANAAKPFENNTKKEEEDVPDTLPQILTHTGMLIPFSEHFPCPPPHPFRSQTYAGDN